MTKRIEYIDALRGFTMTLVVITHIYVYCFMQGSNSEFALSYNNFFGLFRMPLFFFISGFVFYKPDRCWNFNNLSIFIKSKFRVQIFSTSIFFLFFCFLYQKDIKLFIYDPLKAGYWFTLILFIYFILFIMIDIAISRICRKSAFNNYSIGVSILVGCILYIIIYNDFIQFLLPSKISNLLSFSNWQYFIFFSSGCLVHKFYIRFTDLQNNNIIKWGIIILFIFFSVCLFYQCNYHLKQYYILKFFAAFLGIFLIMILFRENEKHISNSTKFGRKLQFVGKHTLDIYFIHYFFLPYNMAFVGDWLKIHPNPLLEFCMSVILAIIVIICCLIVSRIIRLSPLLTYLLVGGKTY